MNEQKTRFEHTIPINIDYIYNSEYQNNEKISSLFEGKSEEEITKILYEKKISNIRNSSERKIKDYFKTFLKTNIVFFEHLLKKYFDKDIVDYDFDYVFEKLYSKLLNDLTLLKEISLIVANEARIEANNLISRYGTEIEEEIKDNIVKKIVFDGNSFIDSKEEHFDFSYKDIFSDSIKTFSIYENKKTRDSRDDINIQRNETFIVFGETEISSKYFKEVLEIGLLKNSDTDTFEVLVKNEEDVEDLKIKQDLNYILTSSNYNLFDITIRKNLSEDLEDVYTYEFIEKNDISFIERLNFQRLLHSLLEEHSDRKISNVYFNFIELLLDIRKDIEQQINFSYTINENFIKKITKLVLILKQFNVIFIQQGENSDFKEELSKLYNFLEDNQDYIRLWEQDNMTLDRIIEIINGFKIQISSLEHSIHSILVQDLRNFFTLSDEKSIDILNEIIILNEQGVFYDKKFYISEAHMSKMIKNYHNNGEFHKKFKRRLHSSKYKKQKKQSKQDF